jgi:DNA-binding protein H-NS
MPTLEQIQVKMKKLQAQAEAMIARQAQAVLNDIRSLMEKHGLTTADIESHKADKKRVGRPAKTAALPATKRKNAKVSEVKGKLPAKYRNPKTGETWSGWARPPAWIKDVRDRTKFLIDANAVESSADSAKAATKKTAAKKTAAVKKAPAKKAAAVKKVAAKKVVAKKVVAKKAAAKKATAKKATAKVAKKVATKKAVVPGAEVRAESSAPEAGSVSA